MLIRIKIPMFFMVCALVKYLFLSLVTGSFFANCMACPISCVATAIDVSDFPSNTSGLKQTTLSLGYNDFHQAALLLLLHHLIQIYL